MGNPPKKSTQNNKTKCTKKNPSLTEIQQPVVLTSNKSYNILLTGSYPYLGHKLKSLHFPLCYCAAIILL